MVDSLKIMIEKYPKKILIIRFSSMGDVILVSALFSAIKKHNLDSEITFVTDLQYIEFFRDDPRLGRVYGMPKKMGIIDTALSENKWDLVIDLQRNSRSKTFLGLVKHKGKVSIFRKPYLKRILRLIIRTSSYSEKDMVIYRYLEAAGIRYDISRPETSRLFFKSSILPDHIQKTIYTGGIVRPVIALIPFAAWKNKEWPEERFVNVGKYFLVKGWDVCIMGGPQEKQKAEDMAEKTGHRCVSLAGKLTLYECGCFLKKCSLALGNDTGLSHLARSCGVRTGIIYGPTTRHWGFYPQGEPPFKIFEHPWFCRPCHAHGGNVCLLNRACMKRISSDQVIKGLMDLVIASD